ncbi:DUF6798 domain-containing protein [uncultured Aliiroseovarius sp.]|uniref:DUF6798 domain-containing protein n=1 Tax=uncultured Aliiroseovarius sp. TaxID=1658783 RepID=UPI002629E06D|nr:DUF6798 domain-containing protein [uncultured Aliiroseovarius sp.]
MIGSVIDLLGFEVTKIIFGIASIGLYAMALTFLASALGLSHVAIAIALALFVGHQSLLGGEWLFGTFEAKIPAYICVILSITAAANRRWTTAIVAAAIGTAFHFLVGGFWGFAMLALHSLSTRDLRASLWLLTLFTALISPIIALLAFERLGAEVNLSGVGLSLAKIYAEYRNPHHVAPFFGGAKTFVLDWLPGLVSHAVLGVTIFFMRNANRPIAAFSLWVAGLNAYIVLAMGVAYIDRNTHLLAPLYMFRPSGLIFLLSIILIVHRISVAIPTDVLRRLSVPALIIIAGFVLPDITLSMAKTATAGPIDQRIEATMDETQRDVLDWLRANTSSESVVLLQPPERAFTEGRPFPAALERLTPASYYVNFKWVPTAPADLAEWYRRLQQRKSVFKGDCAALSELPVDFLLARRPLQQGLLQTCAEEIYQNEAYLVLRVQEQPK